MYIFLSLKQVPQINIAVLQDGWTCKFQETAPFPKGVYNIMHCPARCDSLVVLYPPQYFTVSSLCQSPRDSADQSACFTLVTNDVNSVTIFSPALLYIILQELSVQVFCLFLRAIFHYSLLMNVYL